MTITDLQPFTQALQQHQGRAPLPTLLNSAQLREQLDAATRRRSFFSSETMFTNYLDQLKADVESIINPTTGQRPDGSQFTQGIDPATARLRAKELLRRIGYAPEEGEAGTIKDLASDKRIDLVIKTNVDVARGAGWFIQGNDPAALDAFPAQELIRVEARKEHRDWATRWRLNAQIVGDVNAARVLEETGRMIALKDSGIWQALGDGQDGSTDTLGNPFPPFAFNSGMDVRDISYSQALKLGLLQAGQRVRPQLPADLGALFKEAA